MRRDPVLLLSTHSPRLPVPRAAATLALGAALLLSAGCAQFLPDEPQTRPVKAGTVSVTTANPDGFTPPLGVPRETRSQREAWVEKISEHLADQLAQVLPDGERAEVLITDVSRASLLAPPTDGRARSGVNVMPPRIALTFKRYGTNGKLVQSGVRTLHDPSLQLKGRRYAGDPLQYEKALIDNWVLQEFKAPQH